MSTQGNTAGRVGPTGDAHTEVQRLADEGMGRNAISRELGMSRRQVDNIATELNITWDRSQTTAATKARLADTQSELSVIFSDVAAVAGRRLLDELGRPDPSAHMIRSLAHAAGMGADKVAHLADKVGVETTDPSSAAISVFSSSLDEAYQKMFGATAADDNNINNEETPS